MATLRRTLLGPILGRLGLEITALDDSAWLVQRRGVPAMHSRRIGPPELRTHVVLGPEATRRQPNRLQIAMGNYLGEEHIGWVLRALGVNCVLDVGANTGQFARRLRGVGYAGRIVSFEPVSAVAAELRVHAADDPDWWVRDIATGDTDTTTEINVVPGTMSSLLPASEFGQQWSERLRDSHTESVDVRRLDGLLDELTDGIEDPRVFLKMDTQGYDLPTLAGVGDRLDDILGLQSELSCLPIYEGMPRLAEQLTAYESHGFELSALFPVTRERGTLRLIEVDAVMVRPQAVLPARG
ncbi:FkbM family methyltransferase [Nocardioides sp.]|uniref:FkbM family methyltransferase n=1 Tax=Nocardioides sp. TaxID=35761 RepID=UPI00273452F0|nr:FkbM family methyltransferase [Nocardioides sp.]MDP3891596.1 FkbM family methyltransferase [Nocardioides sp.]